MFVDGQIAAVVETGADRILGRPIPDHGIVNRGAPWRPARCCDVAIELRFLVTLCRCRSAGTCPMPTTGARKAGAARSAEHTSELQSLMRISYAVFCLKKKK